MPELPEVENVVRGLKHLEGRVLKRLEIFDQRVWFECALGPEKFAKKKLVQVSRRGKYLLLRFQGGLSVLQHLRMTGKMLELGSSAIPEPVRKGLGKKGKGLQIRCVFRFEGTDLAFFDTRRFGTLTSVSDEEKYFTQKKIAPDPFSHPEESRKVFLAKMKATNRPVKATLLDQSAIAGVGNIYADEALFAAAIHPRTKSNRVRNPEMLWEAAVAIMEKSMSLGGSSIIDYVNASGERGSYSQNLLVYGREGEPCGKCGGKIKRIQLAGRSTHFCPSCQAR